MHHAPDILKETGHKLTPQRLAIWHLLAGGGHFSADDIFNRLADNIPGIDRSTIYRTLELLAELELVQETKMSNNLSRYEATDKIGHHHMICENCREIYHFEDGALSDQLNAIASKASFKNAHFEVCIKGICINCLARED